MTNALTDTVELVNPKAYDEDSQVFFIPEAIPCIERIYAESVDLYRLTVQFPSYHSN